MNLAPIAGLLENRIGLDAASLGPSTLRAAVAERMAALAISDPVVYAGRLADRGDEFEELLNRLLVPESWFDRGGELFGFLASEIATRLQSPSSQGIVRILCLPCSTGEEPYSLAMALLDRGAPSERWRIDGVDLSQKFIDAATRGTYRELSFRQMSLDRRVRYFQLAGTEWSLDSAVRTLVHFKVGNVMDSTLLSKSAGDYDFILCRNLLIYLTADARLRAVANLERLLAPEGILGVGHAEPQILAERGYQRFGPDSCFLYRREAIRETNKVSRRPAPIHRREPAKAIAANETTFAAVKPAIAHTTEPQAPSLQDARRLADQGRLDDALVVCRQRLAQFGPSADAFSLLGIIQQSLGAAAEANDAFRKALYLNPDHREALTHAMLLSSRLGDETRTAVLRERLTRIGAGDEQ
jgi:chemotaxis protein methyltransferase WspC